MRDKTEQILRAALSVFANKGYNESTTQEIANEAQVAEVTLFRKFKNKQNLFTSVIQSVLINNLDKVLMEHAEQEDTAKFLSDILHERLTAISKNQIIIRTLLAESLMGKLENKIDLPMIMFRAMKSAMESHFAKKPQQPDTDHLVRVLSGFLVGQLVWAPAVPYHKLPKDEQSELLKQYVNLLKPCWE